MAVLQGRPGQLAVVLAIVCASFVSICRATTQRSYLNPMGCAAVLGVQCGNLLASRPGHPFKQACNLISKQWYSTPCSFQVLFLMYWCRMAIIIYLIEAMGGKVHSGTARQQSSVETFPPAGDCSTFRSSFLGSKGVVGFCIGSSLFGMGLTGLKHHLLRFGGNRFG